MELQKKTLLTTCAYTIGVLQLAYIIAAVALVGQAATIFGVMLGLQSAATIAYFVYFVNYLMQEKQREKKLQSVLNAQQKRNAYLIGAYGDLGLKPVYDKDGNVIDLYEYMHIEPEYDEDGNRLPTIYEMVGQMPRFDKDGNEIPSIFAVKHYVSKVANTKKRKKDAGEKAEKTLEKQQGVDALFEKRTNFTRKLSPKEKLEAEKKALEEESKNQKKEEKADKKEEKKKEDAKGKSDKKDKKSPFAAPTKVSGKTSNNNFKPQKVGPSQFKPTTTKLDLEKAGVINYNPPKPSKPQKETEVKKPRAGLMENLFNNQHDSTLGRDAKNEVNEHLTNLGR